MNIVVVEDEEALREEVIFHLQLAGHTVAGVGGAAELYRHLAIADAELIVLDLGLPDEDGLSVAAHIRARGNGLVMLTARNSMADRITGLQQGADAYLTKPVDFSLLNATIDSVSRRLSATLEERVKARTIELDESNRLLSEATHRLRELANLDGLTCIANRRRFDEVLASEWSRAKRVGQPLALAMLDVDLFKKYNDHYGHQAGDDCLRMVAKVLSNNTRRSTDFVARYGGEEFVLIAPATDASSALALAKNICDALHAQGQLHLQSPFGVVTASIGVAVLNPAEGETAQTLIKNADQALYEAKERGRNQVVLAALP